MKLCPDIIKNELRRQNWLKEIRSPSRCYSEAVDRSFEFWTDYELVNRECCPDDPVYSIVNSAAVLSTTADTLTFKAASAGQGRILELIIGGEATASAVNRIGVGQLNATLAGQSSITPEKFNSRSPVASGTYAKANTSAIIAGWMLSIGFNAFGGFIRWVAGPGEEMYYVNAEVIGMRSLSGTSTISATGIFEEL